jgi:hypothetical protein
MGSTTKTIRARFAGFETMKNPMRGGASTARNRLHAILFVAERRYCDGAIREGAKIARNPHLFRTDEQAREALADLSALLGRIGDAAGLEGT